MTLKKWKVGVRLDVGVGSKRRRERLGLSGEGSMLLAWMPPLHVLRVRPRVRPPTAGAAGSAGPLVNGFRWAVRIRRSAGGPGRGRRWGIHGGHDAFVSPEEVDGGPSVADTTSCPDVQGFDDGGSSTRRSARPDVLTASTRDQLSWNVFDPDLVDDWMEC